MKYRVGILGLQHESNTFLTSATTLADFRSDVYAIGDDVIRRMAGAYHEVGGFIAGLFAADIDCVPLMFARALPAGIIERQSAEQLVEQALKMLRAAGPLNGLLVAPHGAAVADGFADFDGHWLTAVRNQVGSSVPIVCTIDPHANLSAAMVDAPAMPSSLTARILTSISVSAGWKRRS